MNTGHCFLLASVLAVCFLPSRHTPAAELLVFGVDRCRGCLELAPLVEQMAAQGWPVRKVNAAHERALAARCGAQSFPCSVLVDERGNVLERMWGVLTAADIASMFERHRGRPADCAGTKSDQQPVASGQQPSIDELPLVPVPQPPSPEPRAPAVRIVVPQRGVRAVIDPGTSEVIVERDGRSGQGSVDSGQPEPVDSPLAGQVAPAAAQPQAADQGSKILGRLSGAVQIAILAAGVLTGAGGAVTVPILLRKLGLLAAKRAVKKVVSGQGSVASGQPAPSPQPPAPPFVPEAQPATNTKFVPIAVDSQPPPQAVRTNTQFVTVESDRFAQAYAWTMREYGRKWPGAVDTLEAFNGLLQTYLKSS